MTKRKIQTQLDLAKQAALTVNALSHDKRREILKNIAAGLRQNTKLILTANQKDVAKFDTADPLRDRLLLTTDRIEGMAKEQESLAKLPDPVGQIFDQKKAGGLILRRQRVPLGIVGMIYESRPNVTTDVAGICLKSGNVVILKGGHEAKYSYAAIMAVIGQALKKAGVDQSAVQMLDPDDRTLVAELITANDYLDLIVPRGSQGLIDWVRQNATVPTIETGAGVCHTFVDRSADLKKAAAVIFNAKTQRPSVCNALDTVLMHEKIAESFLPFMAKELLKKEVEIRADVGSYNILKKYYPSKLLKKAKPADFGQEFLALKMSVKIVKNIDTAVDHISRYSSKHSEAILTNDKKNAAKFQRSVDAAAVYVNASTRFTDGAVFGLGSEIGISTQKLQARGPMGPEAMTTYKWLVDGHYDVRK